MKKKKWILISLGVLILLALWYFLRSEPAVVEVIKVPVQRGDFRVTVYTSGELEAKNSEEIQGPSNLRSVGVYNVQIAELIPEGTVVKEGDWVATLDRTEITSRLKDVETELEKLQTLYTQTMLDTTMDLRNARNDLINLEFSYEEAQIALEQSRFEPPATIRQAEINLDKAQRAYDQAKTNYELRQRQAQAKMQEVNASLGQVQRRYDNIISVIDDFVIAAPQDGMVIYRRNWDGTKVTIGSQISTWDNVVATLPDFSVMMSRTYVNEVDISKVKPNQPAEVVVDAFPEKKFTGYVTEVANIGEQRPNQDARVFEVKLQINESDTILRPAMTTKNTIITQVEEDVLFVPIEAIHGDNDLTWVYRQDHNKVVKQEVVVGLRNENQIIITEGLKENDEVLLTIPEKADELKLIEL
ncbi:MAG: HlyD family secretion protein [Bacteroidales bacterium]|jgi:RND family efflux transporter MFP subunit|nr:HlyD family secretion protein [Bacteroidales bacterium]NLM91720.1 HlyD family efflux transporter periplasmic adaptor subunit [Bacteroidales bacterium]